VGLSFQPRAKFVRSYADLEETLRQACAHFRNDVVEGCYPNDQESYHWPAALREEFEKEMTRPA